VGDIPCQSVEVAGKVLAGLLGTVFELLDGEPMIKQRVYIIDVLVSISVPSG